MSRSTTRPVSNRVLWTLALVAVFLFRLGFGLSKELFTEDETQVYLIGLRYYATNHWQYFGPDVVWTQSQIPGGLLALLVGVPLDLVPIPEAPYILVNLLSMGALCVFAAYLSKRLPGIPQWLLWGWLLTLPWTLEYATHILNSTYVLPASLIFFIGFFEAFPPLTTGRVRPALAHALMGAAIGWIMQLHMSWPLLLPFAGVALLARWREGPRAAAFAFAAFALGAATTASLIVPTFLTFGQHGGGGTGQNIDIHWRDPISTFVKTVARLLSFASYEINRFVLGTGGARGYVYLAEHWWIVPVAALVLVAGILHPLWMAATAFRRSTALPQWPAVRWVAVATALGVTASFHFVMEPAQARSYFVVAPVAMLYAAYCWAFIDSRRWRRIAAVVLTANVIFQIAQAVERFHGPSLYLARPVIAEAIRQSRPEILGYRRAFARDVPAASRTPPDSARTAVADLEVVSAERSRAAPGYTSWAIVVHNRSTTTGYRELICLTKYYAASGELLEQLRTEILIVVAPGATVPARVIDRSLWRPDAARAELVLITAEPMQSM
jgi:hypothetical protein